MKLPVDFFEALPAVLTPAPVATDAWVASLKPSQLIAYALDSGYGAAAHWLGAAPMPLELHQFQTLRVRSAWKLFKKTSKHYEAHPFVHKLDSTDLGDASTIIGAICARASFEKWLSTQLPKQTICRFWHYGVYTNKSVGRWALPWLIGTGKQVPDYLVSCKSAAGGPQIWYVLEAKGTLGKATWSPLKKGLRQAKRVAVVQVFPGGLIYGVKKAFCSLAYLDGVPGTLKTRLVDPEPDLSRPPLQFLEPLGVLIQLANSVDQWETMTSKTSAVRDESGYRWSDLARGLGMGAKMELAVSNDLYEMREAVQLVLQAFNLIAQLVARDLYKQDGALGQNQWHSWLNSLENERFANMGVEITGELRVYLIELGRSLVKSQNLAPASWADAMSEFLKAPVLIPRSMQFEGSVMDFVSRLDSQSDLNIAFRRLRGISPDGNTHLLLNGLLVRERPPAEVVRENRPRKIQDS